MASIPQSSIINDTYLKEESNFMRLLSAISKIIVPLLRLFLSEKIPSSYLKRVIKRKRGLRRFLNKKHLRIDTNNFPEYDFSVLYIIFRNINSPPGQGWDQPPEQNNITFEDDLERIRKLKNEVGHSVTQRCSEGDFELHWDMLFSVIQRIERLVKGNNDYERMFEDLETKSLCYETDKDLKQTLKRWRDEDVEIKSFIEGAAYKFTITIMTTKHEK